MDRLLPHCDNGVTHFQRSFQEVNSACLCYASPAFTRLKLELPNQGCAQVSSNWLTFCSRHCCNQPAPEFEASIAKPVAKSTPEQRFGMFRIVSECVHATMQCFQVFLGRCPNLLMIENLQHTY